MWTFFSFWIVISLIISIFLNTLMDGLGVSILHYSGWNPIRPKSFGFPKILEFSYTICRKQSLKTLEFFVRQTRFEQKCTQELVFHFYSLILKLWKCRTGEYKQTKLKKLSSKQKHAVGPILNNEALNINDKYSYTSTNWIFIKHSYLCFALVKGLFL